MNLTGKKITILGARRSGEALCRLALSQKARVYLSDQGKREGIERSFLDWIEAKGVTLETGAHTEGFIKNSDLVLLSPGVSVNSPIVRFACQSNIPVLGEIEFAYQFCDKPIIAVTGSNGKTTVSSLIAMILTAGGYRCCLCGNIGSPFAGHVLNLREQDYVVLEISSFQLESLLSLDSPWRQKNGNNNDGFKGFRAEISVFLNFSRNHLDRHSGMAEYWEAKARLFMNQNKDDVAVLNFEDEACRRIVGRLRSNVRYFNETKEKRAYANNNFAAAAEVARILGIEEEIWRETLKNFAGLEHRCELVREIDGVNYINDSKSTTVEATRWALLGADRPVILICGGRDKNADFSSLSGLVKEKVKEVIIFGEAADKINKIFSPLVKTVTCADLASVVSAARAAASAGDCILFSPMCASFDMFLDYQERGRVFKEMVCNL